MLKRLRSRGLLPPLVVSVVLALAMLAPAAASVAPGPCTYPYGSCVPVVTNLNPNSGPIAGGTAVIITGHNFSNATSVMFGATAATSFIVLNDTTIAAVSPAHATGVVDVTVTTSFGTSATGVADRFTYFPPSVYHPNAPVRVLDTRVSHTTLGPGGSVNLVIALANGVPANATAAILNVTVTDTSAAGFLTIYPTGTPLPLASNLNWVAGETVPNLVSVSLGAGGAVTIYNGLGRADVVADQEGYFAPAVSGTAGEFVPLVPARITDTRTGSGQANAGSHLGPAGTLCVQITGAGGVPGTGAAAVVLNVTVTDTTKASFITVYPNGSSLPVASNLNWPAGKTVPNRVIVPIGTLGKDCFYNGYGVADLIVDVNGYFTDATASGAFFNSLSPNRIVDTRNGTGGFSAKIGPGGSISIGVAGDGGVPGIAASTPPTAVILNVTVVDPTAPSFLIIWPDGAARPLASDLNFVAGQTVPNLVVVKLGANGRVDVYNGFGSTNVVVDVEGWFG